MSAGRLTGAVAIVYCCLASHAAIAMAAPGDLDRSFGNGGLVDLAAPPADPAFGKHAIKMTTGPKGKIVVLRQAYSCLSGACRWELFVSRYRVNGSLDAKFGDRGTVLVLIGDAGFHMDGDSTQLAVDARERTLIAAKTDEGIAVIRLDTRGNPDSSFGPRGRILLPANPARAPGGLSIAADGKIFVSTVLSRVGSAPRRTLKVIRLLPDGRFDPDFGRGGQVNVRFPRASALAAMAPQLRGGLVMVGSRCCSRGEGNPPHIVRLRSDGSVDRDYSGALGGNLRAVASRVTGVFPRKRGIVDIVGTTYGRFPGTSSGGFIVRLRADGERKRRFGRGGARLFELPFEAAAIDWSGQILGVTRTAGLSQLTVSRLEIGGQLDPSFGHGGVSTVTSGSTGVGPLAVADSRGRPIVFNPGVHACRGFCPPTPVLIALLG